MRFINEKKESMLRCIKYIKKCSDCVIEMEHKLKMEGKYKEYERNIIATNAESYLDDFLKLIY